jgi:hypothetical protein
MNDEKARLTADIDIDVFQVHYLDSALHVLVLVVPARLTVGVIPPSLLLLLLDDHDIRPPPNPSGPDRCERPPSDAIAELVAAGVSGPLEQ